MDPTTVAVLGSAGQTAASGLFGWIGAKRQREFQKEMASTAYQRDMEMWQKANEYNTPQQQMARLKDAGLNPNLVYGNGSVVGNTTQQTPKYQNYQTPVHTVQVPDILNVISQYQQIKGQKLSNDAQSIQNTYLAGLQNAKLSHSQVQAIKGLQELGNTAVYDQNKQKTTYYNEDSKYLKKYNAEIQSKELDNKLKNINVEFFKSIPKQYQWIVPLLVRLIK